MHNQPHTQPLSPSTPPRLLIDRVYEFFTEVKLAIEKFEYDVNSCEGQAVKNLRAAFGEAEKEFDQLRRFSSNFFDSLDNTALRRINSEQAEEIARLKKALAGQDVTEAKETASPENKSPEAKKSGLFAEDSLGQVFGPYKDEEEMRSVFGRAKPARTWWVKEDGDPEAVSVTIKPDMTQPPSDGERQLARAAIDRAKRIDEVASLCATVEQLTEERDSARRGWDEAESGAIEGLIREAEGGRFPIGLDKALLLRWLRDRLEASKKVLGNDD